MFHIMYLSNNDKQCVTFDIIRFLIFREKNYFKFTTRNPDFAPLHVFFMQNWKKKFKRPNEAKKKVFTWCERPVQEHPCKSVMKQLLYNSLFSHILRCFSDILLHLFLSFLQVNQISEGECLQPDAFCRKVFFIYMYSVDENIHHTFVVRHVL